MMIFKYQVGPAQFVAGGPAFDPHPLASIFPPLDAQALDQLRNAMKNRGFNEAYPVVLLENTEQVVDGVHRQIIARELGIPLPVVHVPFANDEEVRDYVIAANAARRHMNKAEKEAVMKKLAKENVSAKHIAKALGVEKKTVERATRAVRAQMKVEKAEKVKALAAEGKSGREIAKATGVSEASVRNLRQKSQIAQLPQGLKLTFGSPTNKPVVAPRATTKDSSSVSEKTTIRPSIPSRDDIDARVKPIIDDLVVPFVEAKLRTDAKTISEAIIDSVKEQTKDALSTKAKADFARGLLGSNLVDE